MKAVLTLALASTLLLIACKDSELSAAAAPPPLRSVKVAPVSKGPAQPPVKATGVAASRDEARLAFKVGGLIADIAVRNGDAVRRGQTLARLESTEVDAGLQQAEAAHHKALRDLERGRQLFAQDVISREQFDDLGTAESVARAQLDATRYNRRHAVITAPADGRVLQRLAEPRELVQPGQPVLVVSAGKAGTVLRVGLSDRDLVRVQLGDPAQVRFDALPGSSFTGRVQERAQAADPRSGTYAVEIAVETGDSAVVSGLIGRAEIGSADDQSLSYLPVEALVEGDQQRSRVYVYDPGKQTVRESEVTVAFLAGDRVAIRETWAEDLRVVTAGAAFLRDGEAVRIAE